MFKSGGSNSPTPKKPSPQKPSKPNGKPPEGKGTGSGSGIPTASELSDLARNSKKIDGFSGTKIPFTTVQEAAKKFVGNQPGKMINNGFEFVSKDGTKRVRIQYKKGKGANEANFETFDSSGRQLTNYHVQLE
ncbi:hypothetical protein ABD76_13805 [Paenibacillus dendritiformis]|nr:hypothetical protein [Paenibacillus dendritiformis]